MSRSKHKHSAVRTCTCGAPLGEEFLCTGCGTRLRGLLDELPARLIELEDTAYRLDNVAAPSDSPSTKGKVRPLPFLPQVTTLLDRARNLVTTWARDTAEHRRIDLNQRHPLVSGPACQACSHGSCRALRVRGRLKVSHNTAALIGWLSKNVDSIRLSPQAPEMLEAFESLTAEFLVAIDLPPIPIYLGPCDGCGHAMYVPRSAVVHACTTAGCDHTYDIDRKTAQLLREAHNVVAPAATIATALTSLDQPVTEERIRKWRQRGWLVEVKRDTHDRPLYRVGDVHDLLIIEERRKQARTFRRVPLTPSLTAVTVP